MGSRAADSADMHELDDPSFFAYWAEVRNRLARTPQGSPGHGEIKGEYAAIVAEYRRRMDGMR
jgi:hypothetical protein